MWRHLAARFAACLLLAPLANARLEAGTVRFEGGDDESSHWQYIGKFGYAIGSGSCEVRTRTVGGAGEEGSTTLSLQMILDEEWVSMKGLRPCERVASKSSRMMSLIASPEAWHDVTSGFSGRLVIQKLRPHIWYFALSRCGNLSTNRSPVDIEYEIRFRQPDDSEFSVEVVYMPLATTVAVCILSWFMAHFASRCKTFTAQNGSLHAVIIFLGLAVLCQWSAQVSYLCHLMLFERTGYSDSFFKALAGLTSMMGQVTSSTLLLVIANGFTLIRIKSEELIKIKRVASVVALVHLFAVGLGVVQGDHADKHHENEGMGGMLILGVRLAIWLWFVSGTRALKRDGGPRLESFAHQFETVGSLFLLSPIAIYMLVQLFAHYLQHPLMEIGLTSVQTLAAVWLCQLFFKRGLYYELSTLSSTMLPCSGGYCEVANSLGFLSLFRARLL